MADVLVLGAHPDDVELCCGGLVALLVQQGRTVVVADLTRGEMATRGSPAERAAEAAEAGRLLGLAARESLDLGDARLEVSAGALEAVVGLIRRHRPQLLVAPPTSDLHPDHAAAGQLGKRAHYLAGLPRFGGGSPAHRAAHLIHYLQHEVVPPSFIVDISPVIEIKRAAIRCYASQFHDPQRREPETLISRPGFLAEVEARSRHFGSLIGSTHGEAFWQPHPPRIDNPLSLVPRP